MKYTLVILTTTGLLAGAYVAWLHSSTTSPLPSFDTPPPIDSSPSSTTPPFPAEAAPTTQPLATTTETITPPAPAATPEAAPAKLQWGVFPGSNRSDLVEFETQIPESPDYLAYFVHWANHDGQLNPWTKDVVHDQGRTLVLFWEASDYTIGGTEQSDYAYRAIIRGDHDAYIADFAEQLRTYGGPVILIPFSEMNGNWSPWAGTKNGNTPEEMIAAYRHLHGFFANIPTVSFGWAVNAQSFPDTPENHITRYYPGDQYVDYVGVDGFNFGTPWESFGTLFDDALQILAQYEKPTFIFSFASAPGPQKAAWLTDALYTELPRYPHVTSFIYFNQDKERNWLLWSDADTLRVWRKYVQQ